ncbi:MAG: hypothetical protein ACLQPV_02750 [Vulcanimicrobiaceae bacterium]
MPAERFAVWFLIFACIAAAAMLLYSTVLLVLAAANTGRFAARVKGSVDSLNVPAFQARADQLSAAGARAGKLVERSKAAIDSLSRSFAYVKRIVMLFATVRAVVARR